MCVGKYWGADARMVIGGARACVAPCMVFGRRHWAGHGHGVGSRHSSVVWCCVSPLRCRVSPLFASQCHCCRHHSLYRTAAPCAAACSCALPPPPHSLAASQAGVRPTGRSRSSLRLCLCSCGWAPRLSLSTRSSWVASCASRGGRWFCGHLAQNARAPSPSPFWLPPRSSFFQSVCVLGYCVCPLVIAAVAGLLSRNAAWRGALVLGGFLWSTRASVVFMSELVPAPRRLLAVYPVCLFYVVVSWIVMM